MLCCGDEVSTTGCTVDGASDDELCCGGDDPSLDGWVVIGALLGTMEETGTAVGFRDGLTGAGLSPSRDGLELGICVDGARETSGASVFPDMIVVGGTRNVVSAVGLLDCGF